MKVIKLRKCKSNKSEKNHPGLPSIELIDSVNDCPYEELDCWFSDQKRMRWKYPTDAPVGHASR